MPEFQMIDKDVPGFLKLDSFTQAYIEAMFWTSEAPGVSTEEFLSDEGQEALEAGTLGGEIPGDVGYTDLAPEAAALIIQQCAEFQDKHRDTLEAAAAEYDYDDSQAGHDFWLTRNHHGAGFWDRGIGSIGDALTAAAHEYGEVNCYLGDDGMVYCM